MVVLILIPLVLSGFFVAPYSADGAAVIYDPLEMLDKFIITPLVRAIANSLENMVVNKVNGLISGIDGKTPSYITNWRNYTLESQARGNDVFRAILADTDTCPYFKSNLVTAFGAERSVGATLGAKVKSVVAGQNVVVYENKTFVPGMPSFQTTARCTLPTNFKMTDFKNDFSKGGGWNTWNKLLEPQNNPIGLFLLSSDEQAKQIATEEQAARDSSVAGGGFKGQKLGVNNAASPSGCTGASLPGQMLSQTQVNSCIQNSGRCNETGTEAQQKCIADTRAMCTTQLTAELSMSSAGARCAFMGEEVTPASILGQSAANALDTKIGRVGTAAMLTDVIIGVVTGLITGVSSRLTNFGGKKTYSTSPTAGTGFSESGVPTEQEQKEQIEKFNQDRDRISEGGQTGCMTPCLEREQSGCTETDPVTGEITTNQECMSNAQTSCESQCTLTTPENF